MSIAAEIIHYAYATTLIVGVILTFVVFPVALIISTFNAKDDE